MEKGGFIKMVKNRGRRKKLCRYGGTAKKKGEQRRRAIKRTKVEQEEHKKVEMRDTGWSLIYF